MKKRTVAVLGAGTVGSTAAYALQLKELGVDILLVDKDQQRCLGEVQDLSDNSFIQRPGTVRVASLCEAGQADIIIICAGSAQKPGQKRSELLTVNYGVIAQVIVDMKPYNPDALLIMVTNPVDVLATVAQKLSGLPHGQVFGSGSLLDTVRLRSLLAQKLGVSSHSVHATVFGEHGDTQFVPWSLATVAGTKITDFPACNSKFLEHVAHDSQKKAYELIATKGATAFGVASCITHYCEQIIFDTRAVVPVSCYNPTFDLYIGMPAVLGIAGVTQLIMPELTSNERDLFEKSAERIRFLLNQVIYR